MKTETEQHVGESTQRMIPLPDRVPAKAREAVRIWLTQFHIEMRSAILWRNPAPWALRSRQVDDVFFLFLRRGALAFCWPGGERILKPGDFVMLSERVEHAVRLLPGYSGLEQIAVHCDIWDRWGVGGVLERMAQPVGRLRDGRQGWTNLERLVCAMGQDRALGQAFGASLVREWVANELWCGAGWQPPRDRDPRIAAALSRIAETCGARLTVGKLAAAARLSEAQFRSLFERETGLAPKQFLARAQLHEAARRLRATQDSVKEIAARCGFSSDHHFHARFRKQFGQTPTAYRNGDHVRV